MNLNENESIFTERYRPKNVDDIILPQELKEKIKIWIKEDEIPNLLLVSKQPGLGKTSLAHVLIHETNADALFINISLDGNIDTLRGKIQGFVSTVGFNNKHKIVVLDEFDGASEKLQKALRGFTEEFSQSARFILTANYKEKIIEPLQNRVQIIDFDHIFKENKSELIKEVARRIIKILEHEGIEYSKTDLIELVKMYYPSTRKMLIEIQQNIKDKKFIFSSQKISKTDEVIKNIKEKDFENFRKNLNTLGTPDVLFTEIYNRIDDFEISKRPQIIILVAKYSYQNSFARDELVNILAMGAEIMNIL